MTVRWQFVENSERQLVRWAWRTVRADGAIENQSQRFTSYGMAVGDAIRHGFRPREQHWVVITPQTVTHFRPGNSPVTLSTTEDSAASRVGWLRIRRQKKSYRPADEKLQK